MDEQLEQQIEGRGAEAQIEEVLSQAGEEAAEETVPETGNPEAEISTDRVPMDRDIEFSHVSFRYNEKSPRVLRDLCMKIRAGTTVGILGATGSGKTTLVLLLYRLWELQEGCGKITIGGRDIRSIDRGWLRKNIGIVQQEPYLFSRTLMENIAIAMPEPGAETAEKSIPAETPEKGIPAENPKMRRFLRSGKLLFRKEPQSLRLIRRLSRPVRIF